MKRVIIESPYAGDIETNIRYARAALRDSLLRGEAPLASHLLYAQPGVLSDQTPEERRFGIEAGLAWTPLADLVAVYVDRGISKGMQQGIDRATLYGISVERRSLKGEWVKDCMCGSTGCWLLEDTRNKLALGFKCRIK